jgi:hypothetical protein
MIHSWPGGGMMCTLAKGSGDRQSVIHAMCSSHRQPGASGSRVCILCDRTQHPTGDSQHTPVTPLFSQSIPASSRARLTCDTALESRTMIGEIAAVLLQVNST